MPGSSPSRQLSGALIAERGPTCCQLAEVEAVVSLALPEIQTGGGMEWG